MSSEGREPSQLPHLATILRGNPPVNNPRLHRGVTLKHNPNNIPAVSLYFFPLERASGMQGLGFPSSHGKQQQHFPRISVSQAGSGKGWSQPMCGSKHFSNQLDSHPHLFSLLLCRNSITVTSLELEKERNAAPTAAVPKAAANSS